MLDRGGVKEQKEQRQTTRDLDETICVELAKGERQYSDQECMDYELEYLPLHLFMNSRVGYQTPILKDWGCGAGAGDRKSEDMDSIELQPSTSSRNGDDRSTTSIKKKNGKPHVAILAQNAPADLGNGDSRSIDRNATRVGLEHVQGSGHQLSSDPGRGSSATMVVFRNQIPDRGTGGDGARQAQKSRSSAPPTLGDAGDSKTGDAPEVPSGRNDSRIWPICRNDVQGGAATVPGLDHRGCRGSPDGVHLPDDEAGDMGKTSARLYDGSPPKQASFGSGRRARACPTSLRGLQSRGRDGLRMFLLPQENLHGVPEAGTRNASDVYNLLGSKDSASVVKTGGSLGNQTGRHCERFDDEYPEPGVIHDSTPDATGREAQASQQEYPSAASRRRSGSTQRIDARRGKNSRFLDRHLDGCLAGRRSRACLKRKYQIFKTRRAFLKRQFWSIEIPGKGSPCTEWQTCLADLDNPSPSVLCTDRKQMAARNSAHGPLRGGSQRRE